MRTVELPCDECEGTGREFVSQPFRDDPYFRHATNRPCEVCDGRGYIAVPSYPVTLDDIEEVGAR